ncbi:FHA domain-containing protein [Gracilibacillus salitolerans]|uniref:FHA domain-containing protein n=2 Tax=Gracilibacillus salitolerans TaxID=2663022 RepID=A0A5Q2TLF1_9BACI|nr:FHA domain-containing protein [Gracilibacillus salitolerans]
MMSETIYGLKCDFEQQQGHFMTIFRDAPTPIQSNELAKIQVNMLNANSIEHVLPIEVQEIDFNVTFYYDISSKKMLSHHVRESSLTMAELYDLLYEIGSVIKSSKEYMLNEQQFVLHEDFIFVKNDIKQLYLAYIPLKVMDQKPDLHQEFRELFFRLVGYVKELSGDGVQQLTSYFNGSNFQLEDLLRKLESLRKNASRQPVTSPSVLTPAEPGRKRIDYAKPTVKSTNEQQPNIQSDPAPKSAPKTKNTVKKKEPINQVEEEEVTEEPIERKAPSPIIVGCLALLGVAIIWRLYMSFPSEGIFYICIGSSIAIVAACYYFLMVYPKATKKVKKQKKVEKPKKSKMNKQFKKENKVTPEQEINSRQVDNVDNAPVKPRQPEVNSANYFQNLNHETTLLSQQDSTVALDDSLQGAEALAYLDVDRNGNVETIPINSESFIIGRQKDGVNYVEDSVGISRSHVEIINNGTSFIVKDLGSKNGSKFNEESMVAYKTYPLKDGDQIRIAKITYTFYKG